MAVNVSATIKSSVSPEFPNGLHLQYLNYIANKLGVDMDIQPMPFARRLKQLEIGKLDILVAVIKRNDTNSNLVYLTPSYEQLASSFFILKNQKHKLSSVDDIQNLIIATTHNAKYFEEFQNFDEINKISVTSLEQKIKLLQKGRVDTFLHYQSSTQSQLDRMNLSDHIVLADYQPSAYEDHYFVITKLSALYPYKQKLEQIIANGIAQGDFAEIRKNFYQQL